MSGSVPPPLPEANAIFGALTQEINRKLGAGLAFEQILDFIFESINILIPFDRMGIATVNEGTDTLKLVWVRSKIPIESLTLNYSASLNGSSLQKVIESGEPRIINDLDAYLSAHPQSDSTRLIIKDGIKASLTCPLKAQNRPVGVVFFSSRERNTYECDHIETFLAVADEIAVLVEQARLQRCFEQVEKSERSLSQILHDLRSPLGIIQGYLDLARRNEWFDSLPNEAKGLFSVLNRNAANMFGLLDELAQLQEARSTTGKINVQVNKVHEFLAEVVESERGLAQKKEIGITYTIDPQVPALAKFDRLKIRRVLYNLVSNAVKYSHRGSAVNVVLTSNDDRLNFSISDKGLGIAKEDLPKLFKEFGRTSTRPTEGETSTGLGLAIAKEIVNAHGGQISVETSPGNGSTFSFWIPIDHG